MNTRVKYTDQPFYPHNLDIAKSLANKLPIIQLPGKYSIVFCKYLIFILIDWPLSSELKNSFCLLFEIRTLADVLQLQVHVDNEQLSIDLFNFYFHSIELIQYFLLTKSFITEERSKYLASIFARMHFVCVDQIQLSYHYETDTLATEICDTYVDERAGRFYVLKKFEKSEIRYIETMAKYLVQDRVVLGELISFMMGLLRIYQNQGEQGLIKQCDGITHQQHDYRWILPNVYLTPSLPPSEEVSLNDEPIDISPEMTEQLMNEPLPERKIRSQVTTEKDEEKNPTCFPAKASTIESTESSNTKPHPAEKKTNISGSISQVSRESDSNHTTKIESTHTVRSHGATIDCSKSTSVEVATSQSIRISTLTGSNLYSLSPSSITINPTGNPVDSSTGRQGEEIVFRFLKCKHPNEHVEWMNAEQESLLPYDIQIKRNNQVEFIEVKTTRIHDQHTFQISFEEMEWLRQNPENYHIYRVYYSDDPNSTKITIIPKVRYHLEKKQLALCMTIMQQADERTVNIT